MLCCSRETNGCRLRRFAQSDLLDDRRSEGATVVGRMPAVGAQAKMPPAAKGCRSLPLSIPSRRNCWMAGGMKIRTEESPVRKSRFSAAFFRHEHPAKYRGLRQSSPRERRQMAAGFASGWFSDTGRSRRFEIASHRHRLFPSPCWWKNGSRAPRLTTGPEFSALRCEPQSDSDH